MTVEWKLVRPAYVAGKLAEKLFILPVSIDLASRKMNLKDSKLTDYAFLLWLFIGFGKCIQLLISLFRKLVFFHPNEMAANIILGLACSLGFTALFWGYELFHSGRAETIIIFNSLHLAAVCDDEDSASIRLSERESAKSNHVRWNKTRVAVREWCKAFLSTIQNSDTAERTFQFLTTSSFCLCLRKRAFSSGHS